MKTDPVRPTDDDARTLARALLRQSRSAALATLSADGTPSASLTAVATAFDGTPIILISQLSAHTGNVERDPRCSLLFSQPGRGDPLAHPRMTVTARARFLSREDATAGGIRRRFLAHNPKAALYADFPDFSFVLLEVGRASLNGGFGRAYDLAPADFLADVTDAQALADAEAGAVAHMNEDHADAVALYATVLAGQPDGPWRIASLDPQGMVLQAADRVARVPFPEIVTEPGALRRVLVAMAQQARQGNS